MAKSTPGTAGSKGGGNVVPSTGFPTRGGVLRSQIPAGRGTVPDNYDYGRNMPRRFPMPSPGTGTIFLPPTQNPRRNPFPGGYNDRFGRSPSQQPRYPMPRNPYSQPPNRYGGMQGPTGLGGFLSKQPAISQRQIDPATGFPVQTSSGKGGSKGGARTFNPESQAVVDYYNRNPDPTLGKSLSPTGNVQVSDVFMEGVDRANEQSFKIDPDILDRGTVYRPPNQISSDRPMMLENPMLFGNNPPPRLTQGLPERPRFQTQGPESLMGEITQSPRFQAMQMGQAGGRPNIRPTMNVGKATGGPVGLASLIGQY